MLVINKLGSPGFIQKVQIWPESIRVSTKDGKDRHYRLVPTICGDRGDKINTGGKD